MSKLKLSSIFIIVMLFAIVPTFAQDTGQTNCYGTDGTVIPCSAEGEDLFGQDANYQHAAPAYQDNGDGTVTDLNTGLMWQQDPGDKVSFDDAMNNAAAFNLGGYDDWRVPTIKELYSLMDFSGSTGMSENDAVPYIDTDYFVFKYGDTSAGERYIDAQFWSSTEYVSTTMNGSATVFGVNFADGRIKGYPKQDERSGSPKLMFIRYVRGDAYGVNDFVDNGDGTITDNNSGLTWTQGDSGALLWQDGIAYCEWLDFAGHSDWRLPNAKELQGIVDYTRSPDTTNSAAIDPLFITTPITDPNGNTNYAFYWTSTSHLDGAHAGDYAVYVAFGEAQGFMEMPPDSGNYTLMDVHGAGAQRSDPKTGDPNDYPNGHGPQGDVIGIYNYIRCVRGGNYTIFTGGTVDTTTNNTQQQQPPDNNNQQNGGQQGPPQGGPPQEAIDACNGLAVNDTCTVNTPQGTISGTCQQMPSQELACVPEGGPPPQGGGN